jgi:DNA-binding IscR family transcriptional regulator
MRFSSNFGTAIHTLLVINELSKTQKVTSQKIAEQIGTSSVFLRNLLGTLKKAGLITIAPRKEKAGTTLALPLNKITLIDVLRAVEPNILFAAQNPNTRLGKRNHSGIFVNEMIFKYVGLAYTAIETEFEKITLFDTLEALEKKRSRMSF